MKRLRSDGTISGTDKAIQAASSAKRIKEGVRKQEPAAFEDGKSRCPWPLQFANADADRFQLFLRYHDEAGLSWKTILSKRTAYTRCFKGWDIAAVAAMTDSDVDQLITTESGIVRNRAKIRSVINNAQRVLEIQAEYGSLAAFMWDFVPNRRPIVNKRKSHEASPTVMEQGTRMSACLKKRGFQFVGPTMCFAVMQSVGMFNDHRVSCFRHAELQTLSEQMEWTFPSQP